MHLEGMEAVDDQNRVDNLFFWSQRLFFAFFILLFIDWLQPVAYCSVILP